MSLKEKRPNYCKQEEQLLLMGTKITDIKVYGDMLNMFIEKNGGKNYRPCITHQVTSGYSSPYPPGQGGHQDPEDGHQDPNSPNPGGVYHYSRNSCADMNQDDHVDILDIVYLVNCINYEDCDISVCAGGIPGEGEENVMNLISCILDQEGCGGWTFITESCCDFIVDGETDDYSISLDFQVYDDHMAIYLNTLVSITGIIFNIGDNLNISNSSIDVSNSLLNTQDSISFFTDSDNLQQHQFTAINVTIQPTQQPELLVRIFDINVSDNVCLYSNDGGNYLFWNGQDPPYSQTEISAGGCT